MRNHIGDTYGGWTVVENPNTKCELLCRCKCGLEKLVHWQSLRRGKSNGCLSCRSELGQQFYNVPKWLRKRMRSAARNAISRCTNKENRMYRYYGERGIKVEFSDWKTFVSYLLTLPGHDNIDLVLDRINNDGNYEVGNLRFVNWIESHKNSCLGHDEYGRWASA